MSRARRRRILDIVASDSTFGLVDGRDGPLWVGKCLFCHTRIVVAPDGTPAGQATIEHIVPRHHGGTDELANLALACRSCNNEKGVRHDVRRADDARAREVIAALQARRQGRWREPGGSGRGR